MSIDPKSVRRRWSAIRENPLCDLALTPHSVAEYLRERESKIVRDRIQESLSQLALYRVEKGDFRSQEPAPAAPGDLAICEGLEAFLIPAVENALEFSSFLEEFKVTEQKKQRFLAAIA